MTCLKSPFVWIDYSFDWDRTHSSFDLCIHVDRIYSLEATLPRFFKKWEAAVTHSRLPVQSCQRFSVAYTNTHGWGIWARRRPSPFLWSTWNKVKIHPPVVSIRRWRPVKSHTKATSHASATQIFPRPLWPGTTTCCRPLGRIVTGNSNHSV